MTSWIYNGSKIICGLLLGYGLLYVYASIFQLGLLPLAQAIVNWFAS